jgi:hypothetical protein
MQTVYLGLRLVVQLMHLVECFSIWAHPLASEGPDEDAKPNNGVWGQLMKINFKIFSRPLLSSRLEGIAVSL